jgi:hypothetical protein
MAANDGAFGPSPWNDHERFRILASQDQELPAGLESGKSVRKRDDGFFSVEQAHRR